MKELAGKESQRILKNILTKVREENEQESKDRNSHAPGVYRASAIGGCGRALQYEKLGYTPEPIAAESLLLFADGHMHHEAVRGLLKKVGTLSHIERTISKKYKVGKLSFVLTGTTDGVFTNPPTKREPNPKPRVTDIKSITTFRFREAQKTLLSDTRYSYQMNTYQDILKYEDGFFIFKNKDNSELKLIDFKYDPQLMEQIVMHVAKIHEGIKKKKLMDRPYERNDWHCKYCAYRIHCYKLPMESRRWGR